jgi:hypothetical protein
MNIFNSEIFSRSIVYVTFYFLINVNSRNDPKNTLFLRFRNRKKKFYFETFSVETYILKDKQIYKSFGVIGLQKI